MNFGLYWQMSVWVSRSAVIYGFPIAHLATAVFLICLLFQMVGHKIEGRAPAVHDSLGLSFVIPPLFALLEVAFFFGYRKELHQKLREQIERNIAEFKKNDAVSSRRNSR
jgi:uncharacterized membrane protein YGL010W